MAANCAICVKLAVSAAKATANIKNLYIGVAVSPPHDTPQSGTAGQRLGYRLAPIAMGS